jgi:hypothetical protein
MAWAATSNLVTFVANPDPLALAKVQEEAL